MLSSLANWDDTAHSLQLASIPLGGLRQLILPHVVNWLELGLKVEPDGFSTDKLAAGGVVLLSFKRAAMIYQPAGGVEVVIPLAGQTQASVTAALLERIESADLKGLLDGHSRDAQGLADALAAANHKGKNFASTEPFKLDPQQASDYADALYAVFTGIARYKARLNGPMTPLVVWPEHFDMSFRWFVETDQDENGRQVSFGFAPFSEGYPNPYLYAYVWPYPTEPRRTALPPPAYWETERWTGVVVDYAVIAAQPDPALYVEHMCADIFAAIRPLID